MISNKYLLSLPFSSLGVISWFSLTFFSSLSFFSLLFSSLLLLFSPLFKLFSFSASFFSDKGRLIFILLLPFERRSFISFSSLFILSENSFNFLSIESVLKFEILSFPASLSLVSLISVTFTSDLEGTNSIFLSPNFDIFISSMSTLRVNSFNFLLLSSLSEPFLFLFSSKLFFSSSFFSSLLFFS